MNVERTKKCIEVMQAFVEGKEVEWRRKYQEHEQWKVINTAPTWNFTRFDYRIRKEPIEVWAFVSDRGVSLAEPEFLRKGASIGSDTRLIRLREVVE